MTPLRDLFRRRSDAGRPAASGFRPPARPQPNEEWQHRLDAYARKVSRELSTAGVPTFSQQPTWHVDYPFWVISVGITEGYRTWWTARNDSSPRFYLRGHGLLLTTDGQLIATLQDSVAVFGKTNPMEFADTDDWSSDWTNFARVGWARDNRGRWRDVGRTGRLVAEEWQMRYDPRAQDRAADGRGTSAALTHFLREHRTLWPASAAIG